MKKRVFIGTLFAFALVFSLSNDVSVLAAPEFFSPLGSSKPPTIPILPPIGWFLTLKARGLVPLAFNLAYLNWKMVNIALCPRLFSTIIKNNNKKKKVF